ncbi:MAG: benzoate transporter [Acidocella sp. 20-63-7]|nr:MAG: benzoate transporter [Acidocella sp. 20-63-7]HQT45783.1 benzoate/H(+) symporter BenE family transporter [Acidocella sp.]
MTQAYHDSTPAYPPPGTHFSLRRDWSFSAIAAGFLAALIAYCGPLVIFFQAAKAADLSNTMMTSWVWGISIGAGISAIVLSWKLKVPVVAAWSVPGTALLVTLFPALSLNQMAGAYITAAAIMFLIGISGSFDRIMRYIPKGIASGMMAGILLQFGTDAFKSIGSMPTLVLAMVAAYIVFKQLLPRYAIVLVMVLGAVLAMLLGQTHFSQLSLSLAKPSLVRPEWTLGSTLSLALPLVMVTLTGQHLPGMTVLRVAGYHTPARPIIAFTSLASLAVACFGGVTIVTAAITAALCTGKDAHEDPARRYIAGIANGIFYLIGGTFAGSIVLLYAALPKQYIAVLAGLALIGAISANVLGAVQAEEHREASMITFLATASGMSFLGLGSAFWGVVIGSLAYLVLNKPYRTAPVK